MAFTAISYSYHGAAWCAGQWATREEAKLLVCWMVFNHWWKDMGKYLMQNIWNAAYCFIVYPGIYSKMSMSISLFVMNMAPANVDALFGPFTRDVWGFITWRLWQNLIVNDKQPNMTKTSDVSNKRRHWKEAVFIMEIGNSSFIACHHTHCYILCFVARQMMW